MSDAYLKEMEELYLKTLHKDDKKKWSRVVCPHTYDTPTNTNSCVLCELCKETIWDRSKAKDDPIKTTARRFSSKKKYYSNMIFLANPDQLIILEYGDKIFNKLIAAQMDKLSEWKNFMHPTQGRNLFITKTKIGPEPKDVDYNVEPRLATSQLANLKLLNQLPNLDNVLADIESGAIEVTRQAKFEFQKTEVRILPSGDKTKPLKFFKMVFWHDNLTPEEFAAIQAGKFNPITGLYTAPAGVLSETPKPKETTVTISDSDLLSEWGISSADVEDKVIEAETGDAEEEFDTTAEPICFGQFDKNNPVCKTKCIETGWGESCMKLFDEKIAIRNRARRLTK